MTYSETIWVRQIPTVLQPPKKTSFPFAWFLRLSLLLLGSCAGMINQQIISLERSEELRLAVLILALVLIAPNLLKMHRPQLLPIGKGVIVSWFCFASILMISTFANQDSLPVAVSSFWMSGCVPTLFFVALPNIRAAQLLRTLLFALVCCCVALLLFCGLYELPAHVSYQGMLGHPNSVGLISSLLFTALAAICGRRWSSVGVKGTMLCAILAIAALYFLGCSSSRTSAIACLAVAFVTFWMEVRKRHLLSKAAIVILAVLIVASFMSLEISKVGIESLLEKQERQTRTGDVLSGRQLIWSEVLDEMKPLGNGGQYFETVIGVSAHNSFMRMIGERGPLAAAALAGFAVLSIVASYRYATHARNANDYPCAPLALIVYFWTMSLGEGMFGSFGNAATLAMFIAVGISLQRAKTLSCWSVIS
jgi:hypothetical protein